MLPGRCAAEKRLVNRIRLETSRVAELHVKKIVVTIMMERGIDQLFRFKFWPIWILKVFMTGELRKVCLEP
jgi:hypothetical protein